MIGKLRDFIFYNLATGFGSGLSPIASGTVGSAVATVLVALFWPATPMIQGVVVVVTTLVAVYVSGWLAEAEGLKDPSIVVADEFAGQFMTFFLFPVALLDWKALLLGFLLFRAFDIWKPWPVRRLEDLPGGWGIVMDDVLAGVFANIVLRIALPWI